MTKLLNPMSFILYRVVLGVFLCLAGSLAVRADGINFSLESRASPPRLAPFHIMSILPNPIITRSSVPGAWDSVDVLNPAVIIKDGTYYAFYSGYDGKVWRTGLATSSDGAIWKKYEKNPVLDLSPSGFDSVYIAANGDTIVIDGKFYHFYQGTDPASRTTIGLAVSEDGVNFAKHSARPVLDVGPPGSWDEKAVADPNVVRHSDYLYLFYTGMNAVDVQRLGVARSKDGLVWEKYAGNPIVDVGSVGSFDENGTGEPAVIYEAPYFYMLYTGRRADEERNLGLAISLDGVAWRKVSFDGLIKQDQRSGWNSKVICDPSIVRMPNGDLRVFFGGGNVASPDQNLSGNIGVLTATLGNRRDAFDVDGDWNEDESTRVLKGSYGIERVDNRRFVWIGKSAMITLLPSRTPKDLRIVGYVPFTIHRERNGVATMSVDVAVNGQSVGQITVSSENDAVFDTRFDLSKVSSPNEPLTVELKPSSILQPTSTDARTLSIILSQIKLNY
jgi:predicted GH43/DUF377 family glycosyl hydrolase